MTLFCCRYRTASGGDLRRRYGSETGAIACPTGGTLETVWIDGGAVVWNRTQEAAN